MSNPFRGVDWKATRPFVLVIVVPLITASLVPHPNQDADQASHAKSDSNSPNQYPLETWAAFVAAIFTGVLAYYAIMQYAELTRSSERQLRAYITAKPHQFGWDGKNRPLVQFFIRNIGKTPAFDIETRSELDIRQFVSAENVFVIPEDIPSTAQPTFSLQPEEELNGPIRPRKNREFSQAEVDAAVEGKEYRLYVFGYVRYRDAFGKNHETPFVRTCSGGPGLRDVFNCLQFKKEDIPRFELSTFDRELT